MELRADLVIADRFRLVRPLGEGGMGAVWLAHHISLDVPCAVKFMHPEIAEQASVRARFEREAMSAARLRSPHVVQILDHGVWEGAPYIAMEYLEGEDLEHRIARRGRLTAAETVPIVTQVARALVKAHAAGLVHRDLKPPNIFLVRDDDREIVKVLDFGVAKSTGPAVGSATRTGAIVGTPYYMSPEQAKGAKTVDLRTDLWALGVVTYQCLTGALPFVSDAFGELVIKIVVDPLPVPSQIAPVPPGFDAWFAHALERDPAARFQSAKELADALAEALDVRAGGTMVAGPIESVGTPAILGIGTPRTPAEADPPAPAATPPERDVSPASTLAVGVSLSEGPTARSHDGRGGPPPTSAGRPAGQGKSRSLLAVAFGAAVLVAAGAFFVLRGGAGQAHEAGSTRLAPPALDTPPSPLHPVPGSAPAPPALPDPPAPAPTVEAAAVASSSAAPPGSGSPRPGAPAGVKRAGQPATSAKPIRDIGF